MCCCHTGASGHTGGTTRPSRSATPGPGACGTSEPTRKSPNTVSASESGPPTLSNGTEVVCRGPRGRTGRSRARAPGGWRSRCPGCSRPRGGAPGGRCDSRTEGMGGDVVVDEVHVEGRHARVDVGRDAQREQLAQPPADHEADEPPPGRGHRVAERELSDRAAQPPGGLHERDHEHLRAHPGEQDEGHDPGADAEPAPPGGRPQDVGEGEHGVGGAAAEDAPVRPAPLHDPRRPSAWAASTRAETHGRGNHRYSPLRLSRYSKAGMSTGPPYMSPAWNAGVEVGRPTGSLLARSSPRRSSRAVVRRWPRASARSKAAWDSPSIWMTTKRRRGEPRDGGIRAHRMAASRSPARRRRHAARPHSNFQCSIGNACQPRAGPATLDRGPARSPRSPLFRLRALPGAPRGSRGIGPGPRHRAEPDGRVPLPRSAARVPPTYAGRCGEYQETAPED